MTIAREPRLGTSDADLIVRVRDGDLEAYGTLYERHVEAANALARQISRSSSDADDLVADAFARVLTAIGNGNGPTESFRPYLLTAVRRRAYDRTTRASHEELVEDPGTDATFAEMVHELEAEDQVDQALATTAFLALPERWQAVLWHTEVEESSPAEVGELLGINANATSVLAHRAREGLRQAYLQAHLAENDPGQECDETIHKLGAFVRGGLAKRAVAKVEFHLHECAKCQHLKDELADLNTTLRRTVAPAILGPAVLGYLALRRTSEASASAAVVAATTASTAKVVGLVAATIAAFAIVASSAVPSDAADDTPPAAAPAVELAAGEDPTTVADREPAGGRPDADEPEEVPLPSTVVPAVIPVGACGTAMEVGDTVVAAEDGGDVTGAALLWNDEGTAVQGLDLPASPALVGEAVEGTLQDTFAFVTDVTDVVETGACGLGSVLTQLPEEGVVQWVLVLAVDGVVDVVHSAIDLVEGVVDELDQLVDGLVGLSVADTAVGGVLDGVLTTIDQTVTALPPVVDGLVDGQPPAGTPSTPGGGTGSTPGGGSTGGGGNGGGGGGNGPTVTVPVTVPPLPPVTSPPTTQPGILDPVLDPIVGECGLLAQLLGQC
jgi:RNA polymerase sigma factor (sigma-70 family)